MNAAIYARVSTQDQKLELQLNELRQSARARGYEYTEYLDTGSGKSGAKLPQRTRLMDDVHKGKINVVLVWRFDRFARSTRDLLNGLEAFNACNVSFISLREGIDTSTPSGRMVFTIFAALAEFERNLIRERVSAGMQTARNKGLRLGRPTCVFDKRKAIEQLKSGESINCVAKKHGISSRTLRRRLKKEPGQNGP
jgi:DNA invertase Pin-like site-specific DNA recombinase